MSITSVSLCCSISQLKALGNIEAFHEKGSKNYWSTSGWLKPYQILCVCLGGILPVNNPFNSVI